MNTSNSYKVSNRSIELSFHLVDRRLTVRDKRVNKTWEQLPLGAEWEIHDIHVYENGIQLHLLHLDATSVFTARLEVTEAAEVLLTLSSASAEAMDKCAFPPAFTVPDSNHYVLQTDSQGLLLPVYAPIIRTIANFICLP